MWYLGGLAAADGDKGQGTAMGTSTTMDRVALMQSIMMFRHPIRQDIEAFAAAESEYGARVRERAEVDRALEAMRRVLLSAKDNARLATELRYWMQTQPVFFLPLAKSTAGLPATLRSHASQANVSVFFVRNHVLAQAKEQARKALEDAQRHVVKSQKVLVEVQRLARDVNGMVRRANSKLAKAKLLLGRKRDAVRQKLRQRAVVDDDNNNNKVAGGGEIFHHLQRDG
jgi:hypothetical protein